MAKSKIGKALGFPSPDEESEDPELDVEPVSDNKAEVLAMKQFMRADTAEAKATALKDFMEACGVY